MKFQSKIVLIITIMILMLASVVLSVQAANGNSPAQLVAQGWTCYPRDGIYVYCMVPNWKLPNQSPASIVNKVFLTQDITSTDAPFVGTTTYLRADLYASQPCPASDQTEWVFKPFGQFSYYYCRHPTP